MSQRVNNYKKDVKKDCKEVIIYLNTQQSTTNFLTYREDKEDACRIFFTKYSMHLIMKDDKS